jgi:hypothetical protein
VESKQNIIAKSKTTDLIIQVTYMDKHITKGFVLVGDAFNKVGAVDYWSTSTLDIKGNMKEDPIVQKVVDSFQARSKVGIEKYGTTLEENNTDDFLEHLQQELMDATLYIQKLKSIKPCLEDFSMSEIVEYLRENGYKVKYKL